MSHPMRNSRGHLRQAKTTRRHGPTRPHSTKTPFPGRRERSAQAPVPSSSHPRPSHGRFFLSAIFSCAISPRPCGQATLLQPPRHWRHRPPGQTNQLVQGILLRTAKRADARKGVHQDRSSETWPFLLQPFLKTHCEPHAEPSSDSTSLCETCHPSSPCSSVSSTRTVRGFCLSIESSSASFKCAR